jgi:putative transposase
VSFLAEDGLLTPEHHPGTPVGVDRGVKVAVTTSTGEFHDREFAADGEKARCRRLQQRLARQKKGGANRSKTLKSLNVIMGRVVDRRADFCAYTANRLTIEHSVVVLEDLNTKGMTGSAKGTVDQPGKRVAQKRGLNRAILDKGWHRLELALNNAARYTGTTIVKVNPAYTSQTCHECKHTDPESRHSQAAFRCTKCRHECHADVNAAKNICRAAGHAVPACGDLAVGRSVKQEPAPPRGVAHQPALLLVGIPRLQPWGGSQRHT